MAREPRISGSASIRMTSVLPVLGFVFAALCVWLVVRIVNRRERWAKWTLGVSIGIPALYVLSFGPAAWICSRTGHSTIPHVYLPFERLINHPGKLSDALVWIARFGMAPDSTVTRPQNNRRVFTCISADSPWVMKWGINTGGYSDEDTLPRSTLR
jgi:hypothetical protein